MYILKNPINTVSSNGLKRAHSSTSAVKLTRAGHSYIKKHQDGSKNKVVSILNTVYEASMVDEIGLDDVVGIVRPSTCGASSDASEKSWGLSDSSGKSATRHKSSPN